MKTIKVHLEASQTFSDQFSEVDPAYIKKVNKLSMMTSG